MEKLTRQEEDVMKIVWLLGECSVRQIVAELPQPKPPYTTVASTVKNLLQKSYLEVLKEGMTYVYKPRIKADEYKQTFMDGFVRDYFKNSYKEIVSFFANEQRLSADDLKDILRMIEKK